MRPMVLRIVLGTIIACVQALDFDPALALESWKFSKAAMCEAEELFAWACAPCEAWLPGFQLSLGVSDSSTDAQAFVGQTADNATVVVAIRGSKTPLNWIEDFEFWENQDPLPGCKGCFVHHGFYQSYLSLSSQILDAVAKLTTPRRAKRILVTGHSYGGAIAAHVALGLASNASIAASGAQIALYTLAAPRVGNSEFAEYLERTVKERVRIVSHHDIVPHLPFYEMLGYTHFGPEAWFPNISSTTPIVCAAGEDSSCSNSISEVELLIGAAQQDHCTYFSGDICHCDDLTPPITPSTILALW